MLRERSRAWILFGIVTYTMVFASIYYVFYRDLNSFPELENIMGFIPLTTTIAIMVGLTGYMGYKAFALTLFFFNFVGLGYMVGFCVSADSNVNNTIAGLISYLIIFALGIISGIFIELIFSAIYSRRRRDRFLEY